MTWSSCFINKLDGTKCLVGVEGKAKFAPNDSAAFVGSSLPITFNRWPDHPSYESLGVWLENGTAWKLFATTKYFNRFFRDYETAKAAKLPIGQPKVFVEKGRVTVTKRNTGKPRTTEGFALVTPQFTATFSRR